MAKRKTSERQKTNYANYEADRREQKNRMRALERHVLKFPDDKTAEDALHKFEKNGVPHRRQARTVGIKLTEDMHRILKHKGKRMTGAKVALLGKLNNPAAHRPEHLKQDYDYVAGVMSRKIRVKYKTAMRIAYEAAKEKFDEEAVHIK